MNEAVDAVITWVDGADPSHASKLMTYLETLEQPYPAAADPTRFHECNEISYCVQSIIKFAPWIRTIFIVTDQQVPWTIINQIKGSIYEERIKIIDHKEIFFGYEPYLPTFNSLAIETVLWRIQGLSEHFIYFNDDCSLIRPVTRGDFFRGEKIVLRGKWSSLFATKKKCFFKKWWQQEKQASLHQIVQENSAKLVGFNQYFDLPHAPLPLRKETLAAFFLSYPQYLLANLAFPLRNEAQFWPLSLAHHLEIKNNNALIDNTLKAIYIHADFHHEVKIKRRLSRAIRKKKAAFICFQSLDQADPRVRELMLNWLKKRVAVLPYAAAFS